MASYDTHLLHIAMGLHRGMRRQTNEDAVAYEYPIDYDVLLQRGVLVALADGVATVSGGAVASERAVKRLIEIYYAQPAYMNCKNGLLDAIKRVNAELYQIFAGSSTTLVTAVIHENHLIVAHAGDSRAYLLQNNKLKQITNDHTVAVLQTIGKSKSKLKRAIGHQPTIEVDLSEMRVEEGDTILLVSDGVIRYLDNENIYQWLQVAPADAVRGMIQAANRAGGYDNSSAIVARVGTILNVAYKLSLHLADMQPQVMVAIPDENVSPELITSEIAIPHEPLVDDTSENREPISHTRSSWLRFLWIVLLLILGIIMAYSIFSIREDTSTSITPVPTMADVPIVQTETATHTETATSTVTPTVTLTATHTSTASPTLTTTPTATATPASDVLLVGMRVQFTAQQVTYMRIGQSTTAFIISPQRMYRVQDIALEADNSKWYRIYDTLIEASGWIQQENLPPYRILD